MKKATTRLVTKDALHLLSLGQLVHELVEVTDLLHQWVIDLFDAHAADDASDQLDVRVQLGSFGEERLEIDLRVDRVLELLAGVAG
jgi:hypothetical protein